MHSVTNIQKYSIHDGDGIRTTVFFKGCPLRCRWCHNPETQRFEKELQVDGPKCTGCGRCAAVCPNGAISISPEGKSVTDRDKCVVCGRCEHACLGNYRTVVGRDYTVNELYVTKNIEIEPGLNNLINFAEPVTSQDYSETYHTESYLGRVRYGYDSRYNIEFSFRRDGSSRFSKSAR